MADKQVSDARLQTILDLGDDIDASEIALSQRATELLRGKRVIAIRILKSKRCELYIEFEGGQRLFVDHFGSEQNISIG